jgi:hypothetical protein
VVQARPYNFFQARLLAEPCTSNQLIELRGDRVTPLRRYETSSIDARSCAVMSARNTGTSLSAICSRRTIALPSGNQQGHPVDLRPLGAGLLLARPILITGLCKDVTLSNFFHPQRQMLPDAGGFPCHRPLPAR